MEQPSPGVARPIPSQGLEVAAAWSALLAAHRLARMSRLPEIPSAFAADAGAGLRPVAANATQALIAWSPATGWAVASAAQGDARSVLDLFVPLLPRYTGEPLTLGHLGQSLDGYIATSRGSPVSSPARRTSSTSTGYAPCSMPSWSGPKRWPPTTPA